jgi:hypothetical protein
MDKTPTSEINEDGTPRHNFTLTAEDWEAGRTCAFATGPVAGSIVLSDGAAYDVTDFWIAVKPEHAGPLNHHIHRIHNALGNPQVPEHKCSEGCGFEQE